MPRSRSTAAPWASRTWCIARAAARMSRRPGAWAPRKCDSQATHQGSLIVAMRGHAVADAPGDDLGEIGEPVGHVAVGPAAQVGQRRGHFPVVERLERFQAPRQHAVDQPVIEVKPFGVDRAAPLGHDPRPGGRKAVGIHVGGAAAGRGLRASGDNGRRRWRHLRPARRCRAWRRRYPNGRTRAAEGVTFDLIGGGGGTEQEAFGKVGAGQRHGSVPLADEVDRRRAGGLADDEFRLQQALLRGGFGMGDDVQQHLGGQPPGLAHRGPGGGDRSARPRRSSDS